MTRPKLSVSMFCPLTAACLLRCATSRQSSAGAGSCWLSCPEQPAALCDCSRAAVSSALGSRALRALGPWRISASLLSYAESLPPPPLSSLDEHCGIGSGMAL